MKKTPVYPISFFLLLLLVIGYNTYAQSEIYQSSSAYLATMKVMANGIEKTNAWAGGQNSPQFSIADMNNDGKNDLLIFENYKGVKVYINVAHGSGTEYRYSPEYEYKFPPVYNFMKLVDYNCDGVPDLFHFGYSGLWICDGFYDNSNLLTFKPQKEVRYYRQGQTSTSNVTISPSDNPGIEDIDHDGDLDIVTYSLWGNYITAWKNLRVENSFPCDTFPLELETTCWGKAIQAIARTHTLGITDCPPFRDDPSNRPNDGNNAMCLVDIDGDGDFDVLDGNNAYSDLQLLINGKTQYSYPIDTMVAQDTTWQTGGHVLQMPRFPAAYWLDIDQDGDRDLLISPKLDGTENYKCIALYENTGTSGAPIFVYRTDSFLMETMVDVGTNSYPVVYDYNKDGLLDLLVGTMGRFNPVSGSTRSRIVYYQNTGTASNPVFTLTNDDLLGLESMGLDGGAIAVGDLDNDGKDELLIGRKNGNIAYFRNNAASASVQPEWQLWQRELTNQSSTAIRANNFAAPCIYDVDKDGVKDLIIGTQIGYIHYYKNMSAIPGQIALLKQTDSIGKIKVGPYQQAGFSAPFVGKIDNTGKEYLMTGSVDGTIQRWEGIDSGDPNRTYSRVDTFYSNIFIKGRNAAPAFADINGDGKYELFIGNDLGGVNLYRQVWNVSVEDVANNKNDLSIYPNPAMDVLNIGLNENIIPAKSVVKIYSSMGQLMRNVTMQYRDNAWRVDINSLPAGVYLCSVYYEGKTQTARFSKTK
jgi:hypothetical protein